MSIIKKLKNLKSYKIEPIIFLYYTAGILYNPTALTKLVTDKLCVNKYNLSAEEFCFNINLEHNQEAIQIDKDASEYIMYRSFIYSFPALFAAIFVGPWLDQHKLAPKIALISTVIAALFESTGLLFNVIFFELDTAYTLIPSILCGITGGDMIFLTACFVYAIKETVKEERTFRFVFIELALILSSPTASFIGSFILPLKPHFKYQVRNYLPLFCLAIFFHLCSLIYILVVIHEVNDIYSADEAILNGEELSGEDYIESEIKNDSIEKGFKDRKKSRQDENNNVSDNNKIITNENLFDDNNNLLDDKNMLDNVKKEDSLPVQASMNDPDGNQNSKTGIIRSLFRLKNATDIFRSVFKKREKNLHWLIRLTILIYFIFLCNSNGAPLITLLFAERAYEWGIQIFQRLDSLGGLIAGIATTASVSYFHKIKMEDTKIIGIGLISLFLYCFCLGITLNPIGFYSSYVLGSISLCSLVGCRGFVSKVVPHDELGSVLSALSVVYSLSPVLGSLIYTGIFSVTLEFYEGTAFLVGSGIILSDILLLAVLHFKYLTFKSKIDV